MDINYNYLIYLIILIITLGFSCSSDHLSFPNYFPKPFVQDFDNITINQIELGRLLFNDKRFSFNNTISCQSCHLEELAFTDNKKISIGVLNRNSRNNSSTLFNMAFSNTYMFDNRAQSLDIQCLVPIGDTAEMNENIDNVSKKLKNDLFINAQSYKAYKSPITSYIITKSFEAYISSLIASNSKYDDWKKQNHKGFNISEYKGYNIFLKNCNRCHTEPLFTDNKHHNLNIDTTIKNIGLYGQSHKIEDIFRFKTPTLRNIYITYPYFHNGNFANLNDAIDYHLSVKRKTKDFIPFRLSDEDKNNLMSFLRTLTEHKYKNN